MSESPHLASLVKFLGPEAAPGHAFAVLGLDRAAHADPVVLRALNEKLAQVAAHPQNSTPEADEVRMILHTAAAQLMSKRLIAERASERARSRPPVALVVLAEMRVILARHGGMSREAVADLAALADREDVPLDELMAALAAPDDPEPSRPMPHGLNSPAAQPAPNDAWLESTDADHAEHAGDIPADVDPAARILKQSVIVAGVAVVLLLTMVGVIVAVVRSASQPSAATTSETATEQPHQDAPRVEYFPAPALDEKTASKPASPSKPAAALARGDGPALMHQLATCLDEIDIDAGQATVRFGTVLRDLAESWDQLAPDQLLAAQDRIVEFIYRVGANTEHASAIVHSLSAIAEPSPAPKALTSRTFASGVFARLSRESDLPAPILSIVNDRLGAIGLSNVSSFGIGARAALSRIAVELVRLPASAAAATDPWGEWLRLVDVVSGADEKIRERLITGAIESMLIELPEPLAGPNESVVKRLVAKLSWREGASARTRLLAWFGDARITPEDLHLLTSAVAEGSAPGVDRTMILARDADPAQRDRLREVYEQAWGTQAAKPRDELVAEWVTVARQYLESSDSASTAGQSLTRAVVLSRLNEAAARIWIGEDQEPAEIVKAPEASVATIPPVSASGSGTLAGDQGGEWALRYISSKAQPSERLRLLGELATRDSIAPVDAEVLMVEAIRGSPSSIRRAADSAVRRLAGDPTIVNAMLEQAYLLPKTTEVADLAAIVSATTLPSTRDVTWRSSVRRALVERLLQLLATKGDDGAIDVLTQRLAESYAGRQIAASTDRLPPDADVGSPGDALRRTLSAWDRLARSLVPSGREPMRLDQVERRAEARAKNAIGIVQKFAADQATLAETMAYAVACERPSRTPEIARVLDDLSNRRRTAEHVLTQLREGERAMLELWIIRLEGGR